jgi:3-deoxy-D-manno-octulosonate 8-phosphate phosphatase (KDO 8-P phosphatase)
MVTLDRTSQRTLTPAEIRGRAARIALLLTDNDGVLTDTGVYYTADGEVAKRYSIRDGMGVELLRKAGITTGIVSGENSENLKSRCRKLGIQHAYLGVRDKGMHLPSILTELGLHPHEVAYIGDDVNDLGIIGALLPHGLTATPADAMPEIRRLAHFQCARPGGNGAFREFADWILHYRRSNAQQQRGA